MKTFSGLAALGLTLLFSVAAGLPSPPHRVPQYFQRDSISPQHLSIAEIQRELGPQLSKGSTIFGPKNPNFANATHRYSLLAPPEVQVVVIPAQESDVSKIVGVLPSPRNHFNDLFKYDSRSSIVHVTASNSWPTIADMALLQPWGGSKASRSTCSN